MLVPRDYQFDAVDHTWKYLHERTGNPLILMPTGTGKSVVIGVLAQRILQTYPEARIMATTHVETLVGQNYAKFLEVWPSAPAGIYSAGLNRRDTLQQILFTGIQSVYEKAHLFRWINILIIDEAHLLSAKDDSMYQTFISSLMKVNPQLRVIGLTATGWRTVGGDLVGGMFNDVAIDMTTPEAWNWFVDMGYLAALYSKKTMYGIEVDGVRMRGNDYDIRELEEAVDKPDITEQAVLETISWGAMKECWMVFGTGVRHCNHLAEAFNDHGIRTVAIHSKSKDPSGLIRDYKAGKYQAAVSMNKLTTGVDVPQIDLIACMRHTMSSNLWVQMLGRGTRPVYAPGYDLSTVEGRLAAIAAGSKPDGCLALDFARNTANLGPINEPVIPAKPKKKKKGSGGSAPVKVCPNCLEWNGANAVRCKFCQYEFPYSVRNMDGNADDKHEVFKRSIEIEDPIVELIAVERVTYNVHQKRNSDNPPTLRVSYFALSGGNLPRKFEEYICFGFEAGPGRRAAQWWRERVPAEWPKDTPVPTSADMAKGFADYLRIPKHIRVWVNTKHPKVMGYEYE